MKILYLLLVANQKPGEGLLIGALTGLLFVIFFAIKNQFDKNKKK